jgi:hypothetical protein
MRPMIGPGIAADQNQGMKIYSDFAARRTRQIIADLAALVAIGLWIWVGYTVFTLVNGLAFWGLKMQEAGSGFEDAMTEVGNTLGGIPLIGSGIRIPFDGASAAGASLEAAGEAQQEAVFQLAVTLGIGIPLLPILTILAIWLIPRIMFIPRAPRPHEPEAVGDRQDRSGCPRRLASRRARGGAPPRPTRAEVVGGSDTRFCLTITPKACRCAA